MTKSEFAWQKRKSPNTLYAAYSTAENPLPNIRNGNKPLSMPTISKGNFATPLVITRLPQHHLVKTQQQHTIKLVRNRNRRVRTRRNLSSSIANPPRPMPSRRALHSRSQRERVSSAGRKDIGRKIVLNRKISRSYVLKFPISPKLNWTV